MKVEDVILPASLGVGGLLLAPVVLPVAMRPVRPILRTVVQAGQEIAGEFGDRHRQLDRRLTVVGQFAGVGAALVGD